MRDWLSLLQELTRGRQDAQRTARTGSRRTFRPSLEVLEDRTLLSLQGAALSPHFVEGGVSSQSPLADLTFARQLGVNVGDASSGAYQTTADWFDNAWNAGAITGVINWGDGPSSPVAFLGGPSSLNKVQNVLLYGWYPPGHPDRLHAYKEDGRYSFSLSLSEKVTHPKGPPTVSTLVLKGQATVDDAPLFVQADGADLGPTNPHLPLSGRLGTFRDSGRDPIDVFSARIDWGDQTGQTAGVIKPRAGQPGLYDVYGSHTYANALEVFYAITVRVKDRAGSSVTLTSYADIVNPKADLRVSPQSLLVTEPVHFDVAVDEYFGSQLPRSYTIEAQGPDGNWVTLHTGLWHEALAQGHAAVEWDWLPPQAGGASVRASVTIGGETLHSPAFDVVINFPSPEEIMTDPLVKARTYDAWFDTLQFTRDETNKHYRREEGFWILYNTATASYEFTAVQYGTPLPPGSSTEQASMPPVSPPADEPAGPPWTMIYTVAFFHTHTPMTYRTGVQPRGVGPSGADGKLALMWKIPGLVYDYVNPSVPPGAPLNLPARLYPYGPTRPAIE